MLTKKFKDFATYNYKEKTAISVRDGFLEYYGSELGIKPYDKVFKIKRTPATVSNAHYKMVGIPVTNEHIEINDDYDFSGGSVLSSEMIDVKEEGFATIAIKNTLNLSDEMIEVVKEKKELSLGYLADLIESDNDDYDFEQVNIIPHHLAIVPQGRCGDMCSFIDRKPLIIKQGEKDMLIKFIDEEGKVDLETVMSVIQKLPEAIKTIPIEEVAKLVPMLQELIESAGSVMPEEDKEESEETKEVEEVVETIETETEDEDMDKIESEDEYKEDEKSEMKDSSKSFSDSKEFKDALAAEVKSHVAVVEKAKDFLDSDYDFAGKSKLQIMKDAIATESKESFEDNEVSIAFKVLKKSGLYKDFGITDSKEKDPYEETANKVC